MSLPEEYEGLEEALNIVAEVISTTTRIPGSGNLVILFIKKLFKLSPKYKLKVVLNRKNAKALGIPENKFSFVFEQTRDVLASIDSVDYNPAVFRKEIFTKNHYYPSRIRTELVNNLYLDADTDILKAVQFVLAAYLYHWTKEPDFPLDNLRKLHSIELGVKKSEKDINRIKGKIDSLDNRLNELNDASNANNNEGTIIRLEEKTEALEIRVNELIDESKEKENENEKAIAGIAKATENIDARLKSVEDKIKAPIPVELTIIPKSINTLIGRDSVVQDIKTEIDTNHVLCIKADGGLGKTAIAKNLINSIRNDIVKGGCKYKYVAWLISSGDLKEDLLQIKIPDYATDNSEDKYKQICRFLQSNPTFLVIDNLDELPTPDEINILNTISGKSTILITSRARIDCFSSFELPPLDRGAAVALFYNHFCDNPSIVDINHNKIQMEITTGQIEKVYRIVDATNKNSLLIELIARLAHADEWSVSKLWRMVSSGIFGFEFETEVQTDHSGKYPKSNLSINEQVRRLYSMLYLTDKRIEIMSFISLFPAEHDIFSDVFRWAGFYRQGATDMMYLVDRGWIIREDNYFSIHTIVRDSIILQNKKSGNGVSILNYKELIKQLSKIDSYIHPTMEYTLKQKLSFVPITVGKLLSEIPTFNTTIGTFLLSLADFYKEQGNYSDALKYFKLGLKIYKRKLGIFHPSTAEIYSSIGDLFKDLGEYDEALNFSFNALLIRKVFRGKDHPRTAESYNSLGSIYHLKGNFRISEYCFMRALDIDLLYGRDNPDVATDLNNLAGLYRDQGKTDQALKCLNRTLEIDEKTYGKNHPLIATTYLNLGILWQDKGMFDDALEYYTMALEIKEKTLGKNHPDTVKTYCHIADLYRKQRKFEEARELFNSALKIQETQPAKNYHDIAETYNYLGHLYYDSGKLPASLVHYNIALKIIMDSQGETNPYAATTHQNIALTYKSLGKYDQSIEHYKMAAIIFDKVLGIHIDTARAYERLAALQLETGDNEEAKKNKVKAEKIRKKLGG